MTGFSMTSFKLFDTGLRLATVPVMLGAFALVMATGAAIAHAATLKPDVVLSKDLLTVGDIFDNAGKNAAYVLGPAPVPGKDMVLNVSTLLRISNALDLDWQPASATDQIVIHRSATVIPASSVSDHIINALRDKVVDKKFSIDTGSASLEMILPQDQPATMDVTNVTYNPRTARFEATVSAPSAAKPVKTAVISGSVRPIVSIPVLKGTMRTGDIIGEGDIDMIDIFTADVAPDTLLKPEDMIGMTPHRMVLAGKAVAASDVQPPQLISRGDSVTIVFKAGPLNLTAVGRALQNGARGELIHVINVASNRPVDAFVSGTHEVTVKE